MRRWKLIVIPIALIFFAGFLYAGEMLDNEALSKLPASELIKNGDSYYHRNHLDTAIGYYVILAGKYNRNMNESDKYLCALACRSVADIYYQKENYSQAFEFYMKAMRICEENGFGKLAAEAYKNMGNVYAALNDNMQAIQCYESGLDYARRYKDTLCEMKILMNLPGICSYDNRTEEAKVYYAQMMKFMGKNQFVEYFSYLNKALILTNEKKYREAIGCYEQAAAYAEREGFAPQYTGSVYGELAKLYRKMGQNDSALHYFHICADYSEENKLMYMLVESQQALAELYGKAGDSRQAMYYKNRYLTVNDSLFNANEFNKLRNSQFVYEMDKSYRKIASLTKESEDKELRIKTQRRVLIGVSAGLFVFIVMLLIVYIQKRKLHRAYKDLYSRNAEILLSEQNNRNLRIDYANKLAEEREKYALLKQKVDAAPSEEEEVEKETKQHSTDKLTDEQKEKILLAVNEVMENTEEFYDCDFSLERLAELVDSNSRYVSLVINESCNKNFRAFVNEYRIKEAQIRLMNTAEYGNYTIKAIAESVGYKSHTSFISIFKKVTGITPSIYQKIAKGE